MITDARVLQPEFVPREIVHRDQEMDHLSTALEPITDDQPGETTLLVGPSGAGKTCIARYALEQLRETVLDINHQYVNCWQHYSQFRVLYQILDGIGETLDIHPQSTPNYELFDRLEAYDGPPYVVILDEVDQLEDQDVLYELNQLRPITMVLIANREEELFSGLDERLVSRLRTATRVRFEKYGLEELVAILEDRARWGLREGAIERPHLETIADAAAGDARVAINTLRVAARNASTAEAATITEDLIAASIPEAKSETRQQTIEKLTDHQRVLYELVADSDGIAPGDLYEQYCAAVDEPNTQRTMRSYLSKLEHYNLIVAEGTTRDRTYRTPS